MKFDTIKDDDIYKTFFHRLIDSKPSEIKFYDMDRNPGKFQTDAFFYFPCDNLAHKDCGFFISILTIRTATNLHQYLLECQKQSKLTEKDVISALEVQNIWTFNEILNKESITNDDVSTSVTKWKNEWIEELQKIPVRSINPEEYRRTWAMYEEYHPLSHEAFDIFYLKLRQTVTSQFGFYKTQIITFSEFKNMIKDSLDKQINKDDDNDVDEGFWDGYC